MVSCDTTEYCHYVELFALRPFTDDDDKLCALVGILKLLRRGMPAIDEIRVFKRQQTDFYFWRQGKGDRYDPRVREDAIARIPIPKGKWTGPERTKGRVRHKSRRIGQVWNMVRPLMAKGLVMEANKRLMARVEVAGFRFVKILG